LTDRALNVSICVTSAFAVSLIFFLMTEQINQGAMVANLSEDQIFNRVLDTIANKLSVDRATLKNTTRIVEDLGADSLDIVELVMAIEKEFKIEISDDKAAKIADIRDIVQLIQEIASSNSPEAS